MRMKRKQEMKKEGYKSTYADEQPRGRRLL